MNNTTKWILGIAGAFIALCVLIAGVGFLVFRFASPAVEKAIRMEPNQVVKVAGNIADYELPDGFGDAYAADIAGYSLISYTGVDNHSHIYLFQLPAGQRIDQAEAERQLQNAVPGAKQDWQKSHVVGSQTSTIKGQSVQLVVSEGTNHDGQKFRQVSGMFQGNGGQAMVVFERPVESWDQAEVDAFLTSIH